jgi:hypothetical protein
VSDQYFRVNAPGVGAPGVETPGAEHQRSALFEQLLARADARAATGDWRAEAFSFIAPSGTEMPAIAPAVLWAARAADRGAVHAAWVCLATPVHYRAEMTTVRLPEDGILTLPLTQAEALAADFNRVWQGAGMCLTAAPTGQLLCLFDRPVNAITRDPRDALGQSIEGYLPNGEGSTPLRQLLSETEMWLFQHGVNDARGKAGERVVNGLWFWGGGAPLTALPAMRGWVGGNDDFFNAFDRREHVGVGSGVVTVTQAPGSVDWQDIEFRWLRPLLDQLRSGASSRLEISVGDWRFVLNSRTLRRFWRRRKPWWEFLS